jgi:hypothetical protein
VKELSRTNTHTPPVLSEVTNATGVDTNGNADFGKQSDDFVTDSGANGSSAPVPILVVPPPSA